MQVDLDHVTLCGRRWEVLLCLGRTHSDRGNYSTTWIWFYDI